MGAEMSNRYNFTDLTGQTFSRLTVVKFLRTTNSRSLWLCKCECGANKEVLATSLKSGNTKSCGCCRKDNFHVIKHGEAKKTPEYKAYSLAKSRCNNPNNPNYNCYGGRGIKFNYSTYTDFLQDVGRKPTPKHSLDRINVNGHYEKGNLRWATISEQANNKRSNHLITVGSTIKNVSQWAKQSGLKVNCIFQRLFYGWCDTCSVTLHYPEKCMHRRQNG